MKVMGFIFFFVISFALARPAYADYVLPYPSSMPGNKLYKVGRFVDTLKKHWYWGSIASYRYRLALADKYLIEAKTLFEYKQYLLATDALRRSNDEFRQLPIYLKKAKDEKKDIAQLQSILRAATGAHVQILEDISLRVPAEFQWIPEKSQATDLPLGRLLREAVDTRKVVREIGQRL